MIDVFEKVYQPDDVRVLAHFQYIDLLPLLINLNRLHVPLADDFNSSFVARGDMLGELHLAKLTFTEGAPKGIEICELRITH